MLDFERNTRLSQPSDALNLLADLALGSSTSGTTHAVQSKETSYVSENMNTSACQENVSMTDKHVQSHTVLVCEAELGPTSLDNCETLRQALLSSNIHLNLPRTEFPQGLPVTEELILGVIVKEHSYSQPSSVLMDLTDQPPLVSTNSAGSSKAESENVNEVALVGRVAPFIHQQQPFYDCQKSKKDPSFSQNMQESSCVKAGLSRVVFEVNGILKVTREWKENYEFALDSKYSNDPLDKCVTRALHGPWNFNIEETFEQVHLILHMWIGLFYSKSTLRFFQTDTVQSNDQKCIFQISPPKSVTQRAPLARSCDSQIKPQSLQVTPVIQKAVKEPDMKALDQGEQSNEALDLAETNYEALDLTVPKNTKNMIPHSTSEQVPSEAPEESWVRNYSDGQNEDVNYTQLHDTNTTKAWSTAGEYSNKDCRANAELHKETEEEDEDEDGNTGVSYMYPSRFLDTDKEYVELCNKATNLCITKGKPYNGAQRSLIDDWMKRIALVAVPVNERTTKRTCIQAQKLVHIYTADPEGKEKKMCKKDEKSCNLIAALRTEKDNTISQPMETITNSGGTVAVTHSDNGEDINIQSSKMKELLDRNENQKVECLSVPGVSENFLPNESVVEQKMHRENESSCNSTAAPRTEKENTISEPTETVENSGEAVAAMHCDNGEAVSMQSPMMEQLLERIENQREAILSDTEVKDSLSSDESVMEQNMCREKESSWSLTEAPRSGKDDIISEPSEIVGSFDVAVAVMHREHGGDINNQSSQMDEFLDGSENQREEMLSHPDVYEDISSDESVVAQKIWRENESSWIIVAVPRREKEYTISEPIETITNSVGTVAVEHSDNGEDTNIQSPKTNELRDRNENQKDKCLSVPEVNKNLSPGESVVEQKIHRENESSWILTKAPRSEKDDIISEPVTDSGRTLDVLHSEPVSHFRKEDLCSDSEEASSIVCSTVFDQNRAFRKTQTELVGNVEENEGGIKVHISNRRKQHTSRTYLQNMMNVDSLSTSSVVHITDCWGSQKTYANFSIVKPRDNACARTVQNMQKENRQLQGFNFLKAWEEMHYTEPDLTQNTLDREYLCFSDKLNQITKMNKHTDLSKASHVNGRAVSPLTITFSDFDVVSDDSLQTTYLPLRNHQITVDMPQRTAIQEANKINKFGNKVTLPHLKKLTFVKDMRGQQCEISDVTTKCYQSHMSSMNNVCSGKRKELDLGTTSTDSRNRTKDFLQSSTRKPLPFQKVIDHSCTGLHQNLNAVVKGAFKTKFKFYIIETKTDEFFENVKKILKKEGHAEVQLSYFDQPDECPSGPLIIIIRNEDICTHVHRIPHLVDLKKVPSVLFAGIDSIDDVLSFNYQELFNRGGFVVCDGAVLEGLELEHLKEIASVLEELNQQGRWKWWLHYKDSKMLKENGRTVSPGHAKKFFMNCCQEAGIMEVLPYHECDLISQGKPEYLNCMLRLQVQHITARFAVFITDEADEAYGNNGLLAMDINTFLTHFRTLKY
ncbi:F208B protein, partial [Polyodon spathula]|nr:F208B protein [Polyodon spathula]